jgi:hypothetical protein
MRLLQHFVPRQQSLTGLRQICNIISNLFKGKALVEQAQVLISQVSEIWEVDSDHDMLLGSLNP